MGVNVRPNRPPIDYLMPFSDSRKMPSSRVTGLKPSDEEGHLHDKQDSIFTCKAPRSTKWEVALYKSAVIVVIIIIIIN